MTVAGRLAPPTPQMSAATIPEALLNGAAAEERSILVVDRDLAEREITLNELAASASAGSQVLREYGVKSGDRVCLLSSTSPELLAGVFAAWWMGAVPVILSLPRRAAQMDEYLQEVERRISHAEAKLLLVADLFAEALKAAGGDTPVVGLGELVVSNSTVADPDCVPDGLAYLQFTSGTTARSRAVPLTHSQILQNISSIGSALAGSPDDTVVSWLPLFHDMGLILTLGAIAHRTRIVLQPPEEFLSRPGSWMEAVSHYAGTITVAPNFAYGLATRFLRSQASGVDLSSLRTAGNGAEAIDAETMASFAAEAERFGFDPTALCPMYGLAEATLAVTSSRPKEPVREVWVRREALEEKAAVEIAAPESVGARRLVSCGAPIAGAEVRVVSEHRQPLPDGRVGEIVVRSPSVMSGYWQDASATAEVLKDGWLFTGDLGFLDRGELVVCGRAKDMIVVGGRNLYPEDFEQCATSVDGVRRGNVIAFGFPGEERMVVIAETRTSADDAGQVARRAMQQMTDRLSHSPKEVVLVPAGSLPKTSSGKLQRGICRQRYESGDFEPVALVTR